MFQPTVVKDDTDKGISIEKRIANKMFGDVKSNENASDIKKRDKDRKNSINVKAAKSPSVPATSAAKSKKDKCIPDWLPEKDNVEIVEAIQKPPHLRCKVNLRYYAL